MDLSSLSKTSITFSLPTTSLTTETTSRTEYEHQAAQDKLQKDYAAGIIQRAWRSRADRRLFRLLKHAACAAERSVSHEILKTVSPSEAALLRDPSIQHKVRFRFAGEEFPPFIVFKIFRHTGGRRNMYLNGKRAIGSSNEATVDACKLMGHRMFYDQMICDNLQHQKHKITDIVDIATMKDYMQLVTRGLHRKAMCRYFCVRISPEKVEYISNMDETPAYLGGRDNYWRKLSLKNLPRTTIMYDIVDYAQSGKLSDRLKEELKFLLLKPPNEEAQLQQLAAVTHVRSPMPPPTSLASTSRCSLQSATSKHSARRSHSALQKVAKMRRIYSHMKETQGHHANHINLPYYQDTGDRFEKEVNVQREDVLSDEDWEQEAEKLYAWSQKLTVEDVGLTSARGNL